METRFEPTFNRLSDSTRHDDPARGCLGLKSGCDVHAVTVQIIAIYDQVTEMQADAEHDPFDFRAFPSTVGHSLLELNRR